MAGRVSAAIDVLPKLVSIVPVGCPGAGRGPGPEQLPGVIRCAKMGDDGRLDRCPYLLYASFSPDLHTRTPVYASLSAHQTVAPPQGRPLFVMCQLQKGDHTPPGA